MNRINIDNYEAFLLDYMEGNLDEVTSLELKAFVIGHPELEIDLEDSALPKLTDDAIEFAFKAQLKKTELTISPETLFDYLENNLPEAEQKEVEANLLKNKDLAIEFDLLKKTVLIANPSEIITDKTHLYKTENDVLLKDKVLAYYEGQLSNSEKSAFEAELKTNSGLQKELSLYSKTKLIPDVSILLSNKDDLKKWALSYYEGLLVGAEKTAFEAALKTNTQLQKELDLYSKTKLQVDHAVVYPNKAELKKETKVIALFSFRNVAAMAAAILLLVGFFVVFNYYNHTNTTSEPQMSDVIKIGLPILNDPVNNQLLPKEIIKKKMDAQVPKQNLAIALKPVLKVDTVTGNAVIKIDQGHQVAKNEGPKLVGDPLKKEDAVKEEKLFAQETNSSKPSNKEILGDTSLTQEVQEKYTVLLAVEDTDNDENKATEKKGFWNKAVRLAKGANKLGIKAIDGNETAQQKFSLSFNAFSVEKH